MKANQAERAEQISENENLTKVREVIATWAQSMEREKTQGWMAGFATVVTGIDGFFDNFRESGDYSEEECGYVRQNILHLKQRFEEVRNKYQTSEPPEEIKDELVGLLDVFYDETRQGKKEMASKKEKVTTPTFPSSEYREFILGENPYRHNFDEDLAKLEWVETFQARFDEWLDKREIPRDAGQVTVKIDDRYFLLQTNTEDFGMITEVESPTKLFQ